jgi:hypothetical protein
MTYYIATTAASQSTSCTCTKKHRTVSGATKCAVAKAGRGYNVKAVRGGKLALLTPAEWDSLSDEARAEAVRLWSRY